MNQVEVMLQEREKENELLRVRHEKEQEQLTAAPPTVTA